MSLCAEPLDLLSLQHQDRFSELTAFMWCSCLNLHYGPSEYQAFMISGIIAVKPLQMQTALSIMLETAH